MTYAVTSSQLNVLAVPSLMDSIRLLISRFCSSERKNSPSFSSTRVSRIKRASSNRCGLLSFRISGLNASIDITFTFCLVNIPRIGIIFNKTPNRCLQFQVSLLTYHDALAVGRSGIYTYRFTNKACPVCPLLFEILHT